MIRNRMRKGKLVGKKVLQEIPNLYEIIQKLF